LYMRSGRKVSASGPYTCRESQTSATAATNIFRTVFI
jgi:hypothetical protein